MSVLLVIPARIGSKTVPRKNLADVAGRPLISYAIETALAAELVDRVIFASGGGFTARIRDFVDEVPNLLIEKPFRVESLRQVVGDFLAARSST